MAPLEFRLPDVGEGIATAEIVAWQVAEGDQVTEHQDLVEIQTDKATVVIPCPANGVITRLCGTPGDTLDVGAVLAVIEADGAAAAPVAPANGAGEPAARATAGAGAGAPARVGAPLAAPTTRRLARELGVALEGVAGSGPHGRIVREDVERAAAGSPASAAPKATAPTPSPMPSRAAPTPGEVVPLRGVRRTIA